QGDGAAWSGQLRADAAAEDAAAAAAISDTDVARQREISGNGGVRERGPPVEEHHPAADTDITLRGITRDRALDQRRGPVDIEPSADVPVTASLVVGNRAVIDVHRSDDMDARRRVVVVALVARDRRVGQRSVARYVNASTEVVGHRRPGQRQ